MTASQLLGHSRSGSTRASDSVLEAVAETIDEDPLAFSRPLHDAVDPDALDALVQSGGAGLTVQFDYLGIEVVVRGDGTVDVADGES